MNRNLNVHTFIGCDNDYGESQMVIFGAPFDSTTSYRPGTRFASSAMRNESFGIETFSPYLDRDLEDYKIFDAGDLELIFGNSVSALEEIENTVAQILDDQKFPIMIGGEHLVTLGAVRAVGKRHPNLHIVHLDAHADLRQDYLGEKLSHATVMRRCHDLVGNNRIYQFGIRSGDREEFEFMKSRTITTRFNTRGIERLPELIGDAPVYFTIDLDVLDPSCFPGTGTPEAGGIDFHELLDAINIVSKLNVIGCDINELSPIYDQTGSSTALACKVLRELMLSFVLEDYA